MSSQQNSGTTNPPKPCGNNCGSFGSSKKQNLCSKCYTDLCRQEELAASTVAAMTNSPSPGEPSPDVVESSKAENRCKSCNKKVGLTGFVCKCGTTFCGKHRYPEKHQCTYDFKTAGRVVISKANPVVKGDKVQKF